MNILRNLGTEQLQEKDNKFIHPWEGFKAYGKNKRTIIKKADGVYFQDTDGNKLLDGPGGMWCTQIGYGRQEMADAIHDQALEMAYCSPWALSNEPAAVLADKLSVMDATAIVMCRDNNLPLRVFNLNEPGALVSATSGAEVGTVVTS